MAIGYWAASPSAMNQSSEPAQKIQIILNAIFELLLTFYEWVKKYMLIGFDLAKNKLEEKYKQ